MRSQEAFQIKSNMPTSSPPCTFVSSDGTTGVKTPSAKAALTDILASLSLPPGLLSATYQNYQHCESRIWLLDNSSRMNVRDSHLGRPGQQVPGSIQRIDDIMRWEELEECVRFHTELASKCWIPSTYRMVNDPSSYEKEWQQGRKYTLCRGSSFEDVSSEVEELHSVMENVPLDQTRCPLKYCIVL